MPTVNLELQLKFLRDLDEALNDALVRFSESAPDKRAELEYMKAEVTRAQRIVTKRLQDENYEGTRSSHKLSVSDERQAAFS